MKFWPKWEIKSSAVQADAISNSGDFTRGLLRPEFPVPFEIKGQGAKRYAVYRNNVTIGLIKAMEANFPAVRRLLGDVYFAGLAREFVQAHAPQSPLLFQYGEDFPSYLEAAKDLEKYPYLGDVARLELAYLAAYHEANAAVMTAVAIAAISPEDLFDVCFEPHPTLQMFQSLFAVGSLVVANRSGENVTIDPFQAEHVLVTRPALDVLLFNVDAATFQFVQTLKTGISFGMAAESALHIDQDFDLGKAIALIIEAGAFQTIAIPK
jgi:Putative DNA-binding domain